ncbi:MAG TPA: glycosyltransferase [bacterium]|nr:glycosyltransferase [bacterium]
MKIIIGSESFPPNISGVATAASLLAKNLSKSGHEVYVFAPSRTFFHYREKHEDGYTVIRFRSIPNPFRRGFRVSFLPKREATYWINKINPELIHLQDPTAICSSLLKSAKKQSIPVVATNHFNLDYVTSYLGWLSPLHRQVKFTLRQYLANFYNQCDYVVCPTVTVKKELSRWGVKRPIVAISNGLDLERFYTHYNTSETLLKYHLPRNKKVLYVGRIDKDKKIDVLVRAIPHVLAKINVHFVFVGSGGELLKMKKLSRTLGIDHAVSWVGWVDNKSEDFLQLYQSASVFAIPSTIETQSIVTMEAMASGLPVVGPRSGAIPELIKDGENGFLFIPNDSLDLALKIVTILRDKELEDAMGSKSLFYITAHRVSASLSKIVKVYDAIV